MGQLLYLSNIIHVLLYKCFRNKYFVIKYTHLNVKMQVTEEKAVIKVLKVIVKHDFFPLSTYPVQDHVGQYYMYFSNNCLPHRLHMHSAHMIGMCSVRYTVLCLILAILLLIL